MFRPQSWSLERGMRMDLKGMATSTDQPQSSTEAALYQMPSQLASIPSSLLLSLTRASNWMPRELML